MTNKLLNAKLFNNIREKLVVRQEVQKAYYDRTAHPLSELKPKENVRILNFKDKTWGPAQVVSKDQNFPRSYIVKDEAGKILRRNRKHIRKSNTFFKEQSDPYGYVDDAFQSPNVPQTSSQNQGTHNTVQRTSNRIRRQPRYLNDYVT
ncbi:hypothetical protein JTE90_008407 [Oedothorax gibbosus]|uniref:Uncharacterized protein n=1 Tax=Oedothorax gibbosus TaxID=931172 RepID=A0AAV6V318_9ARAC|nr:hypothetical protein JTE90_018341 [Oedothorax gibbosus]KAG8191095.1 hypothetical protein JTE90_008407 [Oedothorax gibbosus]